MLLDGQDITQATLNIQPSFKVNTRRSYKFVKCASGNYKVVDRTASQDAYGTEIEVRGTESYIDNILTQIEANRDASTNANIVTLSSFNTSEKIFGAELDYSGSISSTITEIGKKIQTSWKGFSLAIGIDALSTSFTGASAFPSLSLLGIGFDGSATHTIQKKPTYSQSFTYIDNNADVGEFNGVFTFTQAEMLGLRNFMRTNRGDSFSLTGINGVDYPFGVRRDSSYPYTAQLLEMNESIYSVDKWKCNLKLAEVA